MCLQLRKVGATVSKKHKNQKNANKKGGGGPGVPSPTTPAVIHRSFFQLPPVEILSKEQKAKRSAVLAADAKTVVDSIQNDGKSKIEKEKAAKITALANSGTPGATRATTPTAAPTNAASPSTSSLTGPTSLLSDNFSSETRDKCVTTTTSPPTLGIGASSVFAALSISPPSSFLEKEASGVLQNPLILVGDLPAGSLAAADENYVKNKICESAGGKKKKAKKKRSLEKSDSADSPKKMDEAFSDEDSVKYSVTAEKVHSPSRLESPSKKRSSVTSY